MMNKKEPIMNRCKMPENDSMRNVCPFDYFSVGRKPSRLEECPYYKPGMYCPEYKSMLSLRGDGHKKEINKNAFAQIDQILKRDYDLRTLWYKVNWVIVTASHEICSKRGNDGHAIRQKIRHTNWKLAQTFYPQLRCYKIPADISGSSRCVKKAGLLRVYETLSGKWR
jgi:hypothetical protein